MDEVVVTTKIRQLTELCPWNKIVSTIEFVEKTIESVKQIAAATSRLPDDIDCYHDLIPEINLYYGTNKWICVRKDTVVHIDLGVKGPSAKVVKNQQELCEWILS